MNTTHTLGLQVKHGATRLPCALLLAALVATNAAATGTLVYSATNFTERWQNDGGIAGTITVTLTNQDDNFKGVNGQDFVALGWVTPAHVPSGLTAVATRTATNKIVLSFTGLASANTAADNTNTLSFAFLDAAFSNGPASSVTWAGGTNLSVVFLSQNPSNWYVAVTGNDTTGDGTLGNPWATVAKAAGSAQTAANDVIHLLPGVYTQNNISVSRVVTITGNTRADTILQAAATAFTTNKNILNPSVNGMVKNLTLQYGNSTGSGGAVALPNAEFYFDSCLFASNGASSAGGAVHNSANSGTQVFYFQNCRFVGNRATGDGGAIYTYNPSIWASNCTFTGNRSGGNGGAVNRNTNGGRITMLDAYFFGNAATNSGGAIYSGAGTELILSNSTVAGNAAGADGGGFSYRAANVTLYNSTIYSNAAAGSGGGGYGWSNSGNPIKCYSSTIVRNSASVKGGGLCCFQGYNYTTMIYLYSSIAASNAAASGPDLYNESGNSSSAIRSLVGNNTSSQLTAGNPDANGNYIGTSGAPLSPGLLLLADNGGPRPTCALPASSLALDRGTNILGLAYDGRGVGCPRVVGTQCDMGAYERKTLGYSGTAFYESLSLNDGSITNALTVTVAGDAFNAAPGENLVTSGKVATNAVPAGLSVVVTNISPTQVVVTLTGNAANNAAVDSVTNLTLNFLDTAFASASAASVVGTSRADLFVTFYGASANRGLTYSGTNFSESAANDGTIGNTLVVTLSGDTFNASPGVTVTGYPANLTPVVTRLNDLQVGISFSGAAVLHGAANSIANLGVTFLDSAFYGGSASTVSNYTRSDLQIIFLNPVLNYSSDTFVEAPSNDGSMGTTLTLTLAGDTFSATNGENLIASGKVTPGNVPAGLTATVTCASAQQATFFLAGRAAAQNAANGIGNLSLVFSDTAFLSAAAALVTNAARSDLQVSFRNPVLTYSGTVFNESLVSAGAIGNTLTITAAGDTFAGAVGEDLAANGKVSVNHVPSGLTVVATLNTNTQVTLALTGAAAASEAANSISNLTVQFQGTAFTGGDAAVVTNASVTNLAVVFVSSTNWYVSTTGSDATGNGTSNSPYATVAKAVAMAQSAVNDGIVLLPGTYTQNSISVGKFVTISGHNSADTILQAAAAPFTTNVSILAFSQGGYLRNLTLRYGNVANGNAGALSLPGNVPFTIDGCVFASNAVSGAGGAVSYYINSNPQTLTILNSRFVGNRAGGDGGAVYMYSSSILVSNCTFLANEAGGNGGGVARTDSTSSGRITVYDSYFSGNAATNTGGALLEASGSTEIWNSTLANNRAGNNAAGFFNNGGNVSVYNSTICQNTAGNKGGGIFHWSNFGVPVTLYNSTLFANSAGTNGGGMYLDTYSGSPYYHLFSSIVASNMASAGGPDIYLNSGSAGTISNSIFGDSSGAGSGFVVGYPNAGGSYIGASTNVVNPMLSALADNGGRTPTCLPQPGSPAIDHGYNPLGLLWDQRGAPYVRAYSARPLPQVPDIGAAEYGARPPVPGTVLLFQ